MPYRRLRLFDLHTIGLDAPQVQQIQYYGWSRERVKAGTPVIEIRRPIYNSACIKPPTLFNASPADLIRFIILFPNGWNMLEHSEICSCCGHGLCPRPYNTWYLEYILICSTSETIPTSISSSWNRTWLSLALPVATKEIMAGGNGDAVFVGDAGICSCPSFALVTLPK